jgi:hypothetical protein
MNDILPDPLLEEAEQSAKEMACEWIRKTLHEVFLQALQQTWKVRVDDDADSSRMRVELDTDDYADCHDFVNKVALAWRGKLQQSKHEQVALWVDQVLESSRDNLWTKPKEGATRLNPSPRTRAGKPNGGVNNAQDNAQDISETTIPTTQRANKSHDFLQIPYTKLRALGQKQGVGSDYLPPEQPIEQIQNMGRSGQTYWPLDWNIIDQTAAEIPEKIYFENKTINKKNDYQVIPKSLWEKQQQQQQGQNETTEPEQSNDRDGESSFQNESSTSHAASLVIDDSSKAVEWSRSGAFTCILDRKRKNQVHDTSKNEDIRGVKRAKVVRPEEIPRSPSDLGERRYHQLEMKAELSYKERKNLEEYIHKEEDSSLTLQQLEPPPLVLFGALKKVGHLHHFLQQEYDLEVQNYRGDEALTDRQVRTRLRKSIIERLGFHQPEKNHDPRTYRSKVFRTCDRDDKTQKHLDLDLGNCLVELPVGDKKRLFAFSSLEVKLRDEGATTSIHGGDNTDTETRKEEGEC